MEVRNEVLSGRHLSGEQHGLLALGSQRRDRASATAPRPAFPARPAGCAPPPPRTHRAPGTRCACASRRPREHSERTASAAGSRPGRPRPQASCPPRATAARQRTSPPREPLVQIQHHARERAAASELHRRPRELRRLLGADDEQPGQVHAHGRGGRRIELLGSIHPGAQPLLPVSGRHRAQRQAGAPRGRLSAQLQRLPQREAARGQQRIHLGHSGAQRRQIAARARPAAGGSARAAVRPLLPFAVPPSRSSHLLRAERSTRSFSMLTDLTDGTKDPWRWARPRRRGMARSTRDHEREPPRPNLSGRIAANNGRHHLVHPATLRPKKELAIPPENKRAEADLPAPAASGPRPRPTNRRGSVLISGPSFPVSWPRRALEEVSHLRVHDVPDLGGVRGGGHDPLRVRVQLHRRLADADLATADRAVLSRVRRQVRARSHALPISLHTWIRLGDRRAVHREVPEPGR